MKALATGVTLMLLCAVSSVQAAPYNLFGSGTVSGTLFNSLYTVNGTWTLQGVADFEANNGMDISNALLLLSLTEPTNSQSSHDWNSTASHVGGGLYEGTGGLSNCQGGLACLAGDRDGSLTLQDLGNLQFSAALHSDYLAEGVLDFTGTLALSEVPLPGAAWLFGGAILGLCGTRRLHSRAS